MKRREEIDMVYSSVFSTESLFNAESLKGNIQLFLSSVSTFDLSVEDFAKLYFEIKGIKEYKIISSDENEGVLFATKNNEDSIITFVTDEYDLNLIREKCQSNGFFEIMIVNKKNTTKLIGQYCLSKLVKDYDSIAYNPDFFNDIRQLFM